MLTYIMASLKTVQWKNTRTLVSCNCEFLVLLVTVRRGEYGKRPAGSVRALMIRMVVIMYGRIIEDVLIFIRNSIVKLRRGLKRV